MHLNARNVHLNAPDISSLGVHSLCAVSPGRRSLYNRRDVCSESHLVYVFGMATVLGVQILLRLVSAGLATFLAHHVEDLYHTDIQ